MAGLNVNRLVRVSVNLSPLAAARRGFGTLLILGDSDVIDGGERIRFYSDLESVAGDFGLSAPEYDAASLYFGQTPRPDNLAIGRFINAATSAILKGGILTDAEQEITNWTAITAGSFKIDIDGVSKTVSGCDFSGVTNLNGVASIIDGKLATQGTCEWTGSRFVIQSTTTGITSTLGWASAHTSGTDISALLKLTQATALVPVDGFAVETAEEAAAELANKSADWYGLTFACTTMPNDAALLEVGAFIEAASSSRIFGVTVTDTRVLDAEYEDDLATKFKELNYKRTCTQFSENPFAIASLMGRAFSVNFNANRSTITLMYKQQIGVVAANLTNTQANTLKDKRCNVFVNYLNDTAIIQYGVMSGQAYFDEIHGLDWFQNALQTEIYNLLYQSKTKIPQTDDGVNQIVTACANVCNEAVNNGLVAEGQWNADGFGQLSFQDYLDSGYYIYVPPMASQSQSIREQRISPPIQIALKLAGAIHEVDAIVSVNR